MPDRSPEAPRYPLRIETHHGLGYDEALALQTARVGELKDDPQAVETLFLVEHTPVVTMGASADAAHLKLSEAALAASGTALRTARRGGDATWHGPGQWTVYPILRLERVCKDLHRYMRLLEETVIRYLSGHGLHSGRRPGLTGVWVGRDKLAAVGVAVSRWISFHGFAVNVQPDLTAFNRCIVPCGIAAEEGGITSLAAQTGRPYDMTEEGDRIVSAFCEVLPFDRAP